MTNTKGKPLNYLIKALSRPAQIILGLSLLFALNTSSLANQGVAVAQNEAVAVASDDKIAEAVVLSGQLPNNAALDNPVIRQATAPIGQVLHEFGKHQNQAEAQAQTSPSQTTLPKSTAQVVKADDLVLDAPVLDYADVLTASEEQQLSEQLYKIYNDNLAQIALVVIPTTDGMPIFDYTMSAARRFGLGRDGVDDGVLIVVAINDRDLFIATGYGVEGVLPDGAISRIIREDITPSFKTGAYAQGLSAGIARIDERLRADPEILAKADQEHIDQENSVDIVGLFIPALIIGLFLSGIFGRLLGASVTAGGFAFFAFAAGASLFGIVIAGILLWVFLLLFSRKDVLSHLSNHRGGGGFGGGGFGSGGFGGGGGFSGGGGSFGGGGAGGSW